MKVSNKSKALLKGGGMLFNIQKVSPCRFLDVPNEVYVVDIYKGDVPDKSAQFYATDDSLLDKKIAESILLYNKSHG